MNPDDVESIEHFGPDVPCTGALLRDEVKLGLDGKFCLKYNISAAIIDRKIDLSTFTDERLGQGDLQEFMKKVSLTLNPDVSLRHQHIADDNPEARLRARMRDGRTHDVELGPAMHLTGDAVIDKFRANAGLVLDQERIGQPIQLVERLGDLDDVGKMMDAVTMAS